uniref:Repat5 n=1 Tax=Spodoptera exigua TaxID=7107 RepID=C6G766_SPOEX|nr:repat5 [Spodoptera exigua]
MRSFIIIAAVTLSALAACYGSAVLPSEEAMQESHTVLYDDKSPNGRILSNAELHAIEKSTTLRLLSKWKCDAPSMPGHRQRVSVTFDGPPGTEILQYIVTYFGSATIDRTPFSTNFMQINITSAIGESVDATVQMSGTLN